MMDGENYITLKISYSSLHTSQSRLQFWF